MEENNLSADIGHIIKMPIEKEVRQAYIDYSMSVIVQRALPDVRDGLKPVHRRILYAMDELHLGSGGATRKCAKIVGDVLGKYHPHGDASVYDALVRLGQDFAQRYTVITPQGNFGTIAGDPAAAYRYTEAKMSKVAEEMVVDIDKETVDMKSNFDETTQEPEVLPARFPFLLCNGGTGIAVGMATNMPSHNIKEVCSAIKAYIDNNEIDTTGLMQYIKGPDFPTGAVIYGIEGIKRAYETGRGKVTIRAKYEIETDKKGKESIVFTQVPYGVNTTTIIKRIKELARDKVIEGITDANDETSDRVGLRLVIGLKKSAIVKIILNNLFSKTDLQSTFSIINLALVKGRPQILTLKEMIKCFVEHRQEVITRRTEFDLKKAKEKEHILKALITAIDNIDEVIKIIRASTDTEEAKTRLCSRFSFDLIQAQAIVDMPLKRLTHLQIEDLRRELKETQDLISYLSDLLTHPEKILNLIKEEQDDLIAKYQDERRTQIIPYEAEDINIEDMIKVEEMIVLVSKLGYIKRLSTSLYKKQTRGGVGVNSASLIDNDYITNLFIASTHDNIIFISTKGKAYSIKVHEVAESGKGSRGVNIKSLLALSEEEKISTIVTVPQFSADALLFLTKKGIAKRIETASLQNAKTKGVIAINLKEGDNLVNALRTTGKDDILIVTKQGKALRYNETLIRQMGRTSSGVKAINLQEEDEVVGAVIVKEASTVLLLTDKGYAKRVKFSDFDKHGRGTGGQKIFGDTVKRGKIIALLTVEDKDEIMCMTKQGKTLRATVASINLQGRTASGVKIVKLGEDDTLIGADIVAEEGDKEDATN